MKTPRGRDTDLNESRDAAGELSLDTAMSLLLLSISTLPQERKRRMPTSRLQWTAMFAKVLLSV